MASKKYIQKIRAGVFLASCLFVLGLGQSYAQEPWALVLDGSLASQNDRSKLVGAKITVKKNGSNFQIATSDAKGKFTIKLPEGAVFMLEFSYDGYVTKRLGFNTKNVPPEFMEEGDYLFRFDMSLFKNMEGLDVSILSKPLAELTFNGEENDFVYDKAYTKSVKTQIDKLQSDLAELEKDYQKSMDDGTKAMSNGDYGLAKTYFSAALAIKVGDEDAKDNIADAQKKYDKDQAAKNIEKEYKEAIENAEYALNEEHYKEAETQFQIALDAKSGDIYARDQLKEIRGMMVAAAKAEQTYIVAIGKADAALAVNDYITAKAEYLKATNAKPDDKYATGQLSEVEGLLIADAQKESDYIKAIERGETSMENNDYEAAKAAFDQASSVKPNEKYPKEQLVKITALLAEIALKSQSYDKAIKMGDDAFDQAKYVASKEAYLEAIEINPTQSYPKERIDEINEKLAELEKLEVEYADLIKEADQRFDSKDLIAAKGEYSKALEIKPDEAHPAARIKEISQILEKEAEVEEEYKAAISNADNAYKAKDYNSAKFEYQSAASLKPDEQYPKDQMAQIAIFLAEIAKKDEDYNNAIAEGDAKLNSEEYDAAKESYSLASSLKPEEDYPKDQLTLIDGKMVELANLNQEYDEAIASAEEQLDAGELAEARSSLEKALDLKPSEAYPKEKIAAIVALIAAIQKKDNEYNDFIGQGDQAFNSGEYETAKTAFASAGALKPEEEYPKEKIAEIDDITANLAELQKEYDEAISKADEAYNNNDLEGSLPLYKTASEIKGDEDYPISQIALIEGKLEDLKKQDESYAAAISSAESAEESEDFKAALIEFKNASTIKPEEGYPKEKIASLTALIAENDKNDAAYSEAIAIADEAKKNEEYDIAIAQYSKASDVKPEESYPKEQLKEVESLKTAGLAAIALVAKQNEEYKTLISEADGLYDSQNYENSKEKYQAAIDVKPTEEYPKTRIAEIDKALAGMLAEQERDEKYASLIVSADKAFSSEDWQSAKSDYSEAQAVKPEETYPGDQLIAIETAITEAAAMASQQAKDEQYASLISDADAAFDSEDWETAKSKYNEAKTVKPAETYPDAQLKTIENAIIAAAALAAKNAAEASAKDRDEKYASLITDADAAFDSEDWDEAKSNYKEAKTVKPSETYPDEQLTAIESAIAAATALATKNAAEASAKERDDKYVSLISDADAAFKSEDWEEAKSSYKEAKTVKPSETYPDEQLTAIESAIVAATALAAKNASDASAKERDQKYTSLIYDADAAFQTEDWETAKAKYREAKSVKSSESYPDEQLSAIDGAIAAAAALAAKNKADANARDIQENYDNYISLADKAFTKKEWQDAKTNYQNALSVKENESYPKDQIVFVEAEIKASSELAEKDQFDAYLSTADRAFKSKDWESAKSNYNSALSVFPNEQYPKDQLKRVEESISKEQSIALSSKQDETYKQTIGDADQLFNNSDWDASKSKYEEALSIKPNEVYPKNRIIKINELISGQANAAKKDMEYQKLIVNADASFDRKDYPSARKTYTQALAIKNDAYPRSQINEIDDILNAEKASVVALKSASEREQKQYDKLISEGDRNFTSKQYQQAKSKYQSALDVKSNETYPKNKIAEINDLLSKEPELKTTPLAKKSSGMSDEEIAAMMAAWQLERDEAKVDKMNQYQAELKETSDDRNMNADDRREEATNDLVDLENEIAESNKSGKDRNLEEALLVEEIRDDQKKFNADLSEDSENARNDLYSDIEKSEMGQIEMKEKGDELHLVNTEESTTTKIEVIQAEKERKENADIGITVAKEGIEEIQVGINEDREKSKDHYMDEVDRIEKDNEFAYASVRTWSDDSKESRSDNYDEIVDLENDIRDFNSDNAESYMANTENYNETTTELSEYKDEKNNQANDNRTKAYNDITDYTDEVSELTQERHNSYDESNELIRKEQIKITDQQAELKANADERRLDFDRDYYTGEKKPRYPEIAREHRQGVTEESYQENEAYVIKRIVVTGENIDEYKKIFYKWGAVYYEKNGRDITEVIWNTETE